MNTLPLAELREIVLTSRNFQAYNEQNAVLLGHARELTAL